MQSGWNQNHAMVFLRLNSACKSAEYPKIIEYCTRQSSIIGYNGSNRFNLLCDSYAVSGCASQKAHLLPDKCL